LSGEYKFFGQVSLRPKWNLFPKFLIFSLVLSIQTNWVIGQTINDFKEIWVNESREYLLNNQKPLPYLQSGFHHFSRLENEKFTEVLEGKWDFFQVLTARPVPKSRKFESQPQFVYEEASYHNPHILPYFLAENKPDESNSINLPRIRKPEYTSSGLLKLNFKFYGNNLAITCDRFLTLPVNQPPGRDIVIEFWRKFLIGNSQHLISQLLILRDRLGLNDWGYFLLVKTVSKELYVSDETGSTLLSWGLMLHSGYDVKIGYNQLGSTLMYKTKDKIYGTPFVKIDNSEFYIDRPIASFPIHTYLDAHPGALGTIGLSFKKAINFQGTFETKKFDFFWNRKQYEFNIKYNPMVINYLEDYPQTEPELFFGSPFTYSTLESLRKQMKPVLAGMKTVEAAAFLQQFVQKSFAYRPYNDLFGFDRFMFPEELLFKEESNDKGKSLLYAWLISNLLNQQAILVEFPGFYSVAISLDQPMDGDNFQLEGRNFTFADPTFNDAPLGLIMSELFALKPLLHPLGTNAHELNEEQKIWKLAQTFGAKRSGSGKDFVRGENGNTYITGYLNEKNIAHPSPSPTPFLAKFNALNSLEWMVKFRSEGSAFGLELKQLDNNELYLAGSFRGKLECNGKLIQTGLSDPDLFFVQFNKMGEIGWMTKSGLDELDEDTKLFYVVKFDRTGEIQSVQLANEDERAGTTGFQLSSNEGLCYIASRYQTTGLDKQGEELAVKPILAYRQNFNRMKQLGTEETIASLTAVLKSVIHTGSQLSGSDLYSLRRVKAIPEINSTTSITEMLQNLRQIKNNYGIIEITTANGIPLSIPPYTISNRSHLKIVPTDNNDLKINVIDGFGIETGVQREKINSMIIELNTGNLILDIGSEHQVITRSLRHQVTK